MVSASNGEKPLDCSGFGVARMCGGSDPKRHPFTSANRFQRLAHDVVLRVAVRPFVAPVVERLLNRDGERL